MSQGIFFSFLFLFPSSVLLLLSLPSHQPSSSVSTLLPQPAAAFMAIKLVEAFWSCICQFLNESFKQVILRGLSPFAHLNSCQPPCVCLGRVLFVLVIFFLKNICVCVCVHTKNVPWQSRQTRLNSELTVNSCSLNKPFFIIPLLPSCVSNSD